MSRCEQIPIVLFAYTRPQHLQSTLQCLKANQVPLIYAYSDGHRSPDEQEAVAQVRAILRGIDWCEVVLVERGENLGLGRSILAGVTEVLKRHDCAIVFEDDLTCVPGTYDYLCAALRHYQSENTVMSVTAWTHPKVTPHGITDQPYFDGRAECWVWGTWARAWDGMMGDDAKTLMQKCVQKGIDPYRYGADLPAMAEVERVRNIWAVRWLYLHMLRGGLCLRPPYSLVENIGLDSSATNPGGSLLWTDMLRGSCPPLPEEWPTPIENPECYLLWQRVYGYRKTFLRRVVSQLLRAARRVKCALFPGRYPVR